MISLTGIITATAVVLGLLLMLDLVFGGKGKIERSWRGNFVIIGFVRATSKLLNSTIQRLPTHP